MSFIAGFFYFTILHTCVDAETKLEDESKTKTAEAHRKTNLQPWVPQLLSMMRSWKRELVRGETLSLSLH